MAEKGSGKRRRMAVALEEVVGCAWQIGKGRWMVVVVSLYILFFSGATYIFGIYSGAIKSALGYNQQTVDMLSFFKDLGANVGIVSGLINEVAPPWVVLAIGAVMNVFGYVMIWLATTQRLRPAPSPGYMYLYMCVGANSQTFANTGALVTCVKNFPHSRGVVLGLVKGCVGLSGAIFTQIYHAVYGQDSSGIILLIAVLPTAINLLFMFVVRPTPPPPLLSGSTSSAAAAQDKHFFSFLYISLALAAFLMVIIIVENLLPSSAVVFKAAAAITLLLVAANVLVAVQAEVTEAAAAAAARQLTMTDDHQLLPTLCGSSTIPPSSTQLPSVQQIHELQPNQPIMKQAELMPDAAGSALILSSSGNGVDLQGVEPVQPPQGPMVSTGGLHKHVHHGRANGTADGSGAGVRAAGLLRRCWAGFLDYMQWPERGEDFTIMQAVLSLDMWILFVSVTCGIGAALTAIDNLGQIGESLGYSGASISTCVSLISIWNFLGRVMAGFGSEYLLSRFRFPRTLALTAIMAVACVGHILVAFPAPGTLYVASVIVGLCFGAQWPLLYAIVSELFGLKYYATLYNVGGVASPLGSYLLNVKVAGYLYDREALRQSLTAAEAASTSITCMGSACFRLTFIIMTIVSGGGSLISLLLVTRTRRFYAQDIYARFSTPSAAAAPFPAISHTAAEQQPKGEAAAAKTYGSVDDHTADDHKFDAPAAPASTAGGPACV